MMITIFLVLIPGIILGFSFLAIDYISEIKPIQKWELKHKETYISIIAGVSVSFIFLDVIPNLNRDFPDPFLELLLYFFIFFGFVIIHLSEKFIMQSVEKKTQKKIKELDYIEGILEQEEKSLEQYIDEMIDKGDMDAESLKLLVKSNHQIHKKELEVQSEENKLKLQIFGHIYKDLSTLNASLDYATHLLAGVLIVEFLTIHYFNAFLFFIFAVLKSIISNPLNRHLKVTLGKEDFEIHIFRGENKWRKILFTSSVPSGVIIGFLLVSFVPINQFVYDAIFAFIVGVFFYVTIREVLPEREKGKPLYFLLGAVLFTLVIVLLNYVELFIHI